MVEVVKPLRDNLDACLIFPSMPEVMRLNKVRLGFLILCGCIDIYMVGRSPFHWPRPSRGKSHIRSPRPSPNPNQPNPTPITLHTQVGSFTMNSMGSSKSIIGDFMKAKKKDGGSGFEEGLLKLLRTLPKVLKYLPSDKAQVRLVLYMYVYHMRVD